LLSFHCAMIPRPLQSSLFPYTTLFRSTLYDHLQEIISVKPEMWEGWLYVHTMPGKRERSNKRRRNQSYWPCRVGTRYYMMISPRDRKSTRLNSSHVKISYAVFCLKKKT